MVTMMCADRRVDGLRDQMIAERVLVARVCLEYPPLVRAKRPGKKPRLLQNPLGADVCWRRRANGLLDQLREAPDLL